MSISGVPDAGEMLWEFSPAVRLPEAGTPASG
jgi:hypothetical protein